MNITASPRTTRNLPQITIQFTGALPAGSPAGLSTGNRSILMGTERSRHLNILDTKTEDLYFGTNWTVGDHELKGLVDYSDNKIFNASPGHQRTKVHVFVRKQQCDVYHSFGSITCGTATNAQVDAAVFENFQRGRPSSYQVQVPLKPTVL